MEANKLNGSAYEMLSLIRERTKEFVISEGRRPRILVTTIGNEKHDVALKVIATAFADFGFDVDINPLSQTPELVARSAVEIDVHIIILSAAPNLYTSMVAQISEELDKMGGRQIKILVTGDVPMEDRQSLFDAGVIAILDSPQVDPKVANRILDVLENQE